MSARRLRRGARRLRRKAGRLLQRSRPRFWLYLAGPVLVGVAFGAETATELLSPVAVVLFAYFLLPANVFLYGINDVFDADADADNPKKERRELRYRGDPLTVWSVAVATLLGLLVAGWVPRIAAPWIVGFLLLGAAYSAPPRLKTRPPLDSVSNGLYVLPGGAAYAALAGSHPPVPAVLGGWLWSMAMHTFSAIPDIDPDRAAGLRTTATVLGERRALGYCAGCWLAAALTFGWLDLRAGGLLLLYPVLVVVIDRLDVPIRRAYWWYPWINTLVGTTITLAGLWRLYG